jgi:UrcA family protein
MTKSRTALLGALVTSAAVLAGAAWAQDYRDDRATYDAVPVYRDAGPSYHDSDVYDDRTETVIVRPDHDFIQKHQVIGRVNGEVNPTAYSLQRPVELADLDLSRAADRQEMRNRVYETAVNLCYELDDRVPGLREDESADRECVRTATRNAIRDVMDRRG